MYAVYGIVLVGWAYRESLLGLFLVILAFFFHNTSLHILLCSIIAFQLLYILYISSDIIPHFPNLDHQLNWIVRPGQH
jgi:hypothetical protein